MPFWYHMHLHMYEGPKLWSSISNCIKTIENISEFETLLKKMDWNSLHM